jgi:uncharacterized protein YceK
MIKFSALLFVVIATLSGCGSLEKKSILVNVGDTKDKVVAQMGVPDDRQVKDSNEAWQYCQTGAGFGWHDYRIIWFRDGRVTGLNSYKSTRPGSSCMADIRAIRWEEAPNTIVEIRNR